MLNPRGPTKSATSASPLVVDSSSPAAVDTDFMIIDEVVVHDSALEIPDFGNLSDQSPIGSLVWVKLFDQSARPLDKAKLDSSGQILYNVIPKDFYIDPDHLAISSATKIILPKTDTLITLGTKPRATIIVQDKGLGLFLVSRFSARTSPETILRSRSPCPVLEYHISWDVLADFLPAETCTCARRRERPF